jgi:F0F1-type ATP synthase assembly protein I
MNPDETPESNGLESESDDRSAIAKSVDLAYALMSICAMLALPALGGFYLDRWLGTRLLFTVIGLLFGLAASVLQFLKLLKRLEQNSTANPSKPKGNEKGR